MKIIDGHMHILQWERSDGKSTFDVIEEYRENNHIAYVDNMCCSNNGDLWDGYEMDQSILGAIAKIENPHVFTHGCLYIPQDPAQYQKYNFKDQLDELMELGLDGIKICDFKPDAYKVLNVESRLADYDEYLGYCEKYGVHLCWHVADPDSFWDLNRIHPRHLAKGWYYGEGDYLSWQKIYDMVFRVLERHPKLKVTFAHFFFWSPWPEKLEELFETYEHVTVDITPGAEMYGFFRDQYQRYRNFFIRYADRILYGTDVSFPSSKTNSLRPEQVYRFLTTDEELTLVDIPTRGLNLPEEVCSKILHQNFEGFSGPAPKPVDRAKLRADIQKYLPYIQDQEALTHIRQQMDTL
jgi:predicted TIM-barrel fold metal-dependent hydrolase